MLVTTKDVVATAAVNAGVAADRLKEYMRSGDGLPVLQSELQKTAKLLSKALADVMLAMHMSDGTWTETTYVNAWERHSRIEDDVIANQE